MFLCRLEPWLLQACEEWRAGPLRAGGEGISFQPGWIPT